MKVLFYLVSFIGICQYHLAAQAKVILTYDKYINDIKLNHPIIKIASINLDIQDAKRMEAAGAFDPVISANVDRKVFKDDLYYSYQNAEIYLPTWYGIELYSGIENNSGLNSNPELSIGDLTYAGISIPLARDLLLDKRRAKLAEAKLMQNFTAEEQRIRINDLLLDASIAYTNWVLFFTETQLLSNSLELVRTRKQAVIQAIKGGDRAATDSIELNAQYNSILQSYQNAISDFINSQFELSSYLWSEGGLPLLVNENTMPDTLFISQTLLNSIESKTPEDMAASHPKIKLIDIKLKIEEIGQKMAIQSLLPKADLKFNFISSGGLGSSFFETALKENYKLGFDFSIPIPNRTAKSYNRIQKDKIQNLTFERNLNLNQLTIKARSYLNEMDQLSLQLLSIENAISDYIKLRDAEDVRFKLGESSVFLMNNRENKVIETKLKAIELRGKLMKANLKFRNLSFNL